MGPDREAAKKLIWDFFQGAGTEQTKPGLVIREDDVMKIQLCFCKA